MADLRDDVAALGAVLRTDHHPSWSYHCHATLSEAPYTRLQAGGNGFVCGARTDPDAPYDGFPYMIISNTYYEVDPFGEFGEQYVGKSIDVEVDFSGTAVAVDQLRRYDFAAHQMELTTTPMQENGHFSLTLAPFDVVIVKLDSGPGGCGLVGIEPAVVLMGISAWRCRPRRASPGRAA